MNDCQSPPPPEKSGAGKKHWNKPALVRLKQNNVDTKTQDDPTEFTTTFGTDKYYYGDLEMHPS